MDRLTGILVQLLVTDRYFQRPSILARQVEGEDVFFCLPDPCHLPTWLGYYRLFGGSLILAFQIKSDDT